MKGEKRPIHLNNLFGFRYTRLQLSMQSVIQLIDSREILLYSFNTCSVSKFGMVQVYTLIIYFPCLQTRDAFVTLLCYPVVKMIHGFRKSI